MLQVQLLGEFVVTQGTITLTTLYAPRLQSLVAWLVLHAGTPQPRAQLAFTFWPDSSEAQARTNLRKAIYHLQQALPDAKRFLHITRPTITWRADAPYTLDVAAFMHAAATAHTPAAIARAVALYCGDLLPASYDDWVAQERERLRHMFAELLNKGIAYCETVGAYAMAVGYAQRLVEHDPLQEAAYRHLVRLQALGGDRAAALATYHTCARVLQHELGVAPSRATRELYEQVVAEHLGTAQVTTSLPVHCDQLPAPLTPFIGRERDVAAVTALLHRPGVRLVTLAGTGGTGKTRLAIQVASIVCERFRDGVVWVDLSAIHNSALVMPAIARALGVAEDGEQLAERVHAYVRPKQLLVLLDNFEQIVAAAPEVTAMLEAAPQLVVVTTSREALQVYGEHVWEVPPLTLPDRHHLPPHHVLLHNDAVRLFVYHAQAAHARFVLDPQDDVAVVELCVQLDGLPLAIELAAARINTVPIAAMLEQMHDRLALLAYGWRNKPERHQTLRATIAWSYHLLRTEEQRVFRCMGVFVGGCTEDAAAAVCAARNAPPTDIPAVLRSLAAKSLLRYEDGNGAAPRVHMLETIRAYARERLQQSGEAAPLQQRHAQYYFQLASMAEGPITKGEQGGWFERLERDHDNLRAVLHWAQQTGEEALGLHLGAVLVRFWQARGYIGEGRRWLETLLAHNAELPAAVRAQALNDIGTLATQQSEYATAVSMLQHSLALWRTLGNTRQIAFTINNLGNIAMYQGAYSHAQALFEESLALRRELGDTVGIASALNNLGNVALEQGDYTSAAQFHAESLALRRQTGDTWSIAVSLNNLGLLALNQGNYERTRTTLAESLALFKELGDKNSAAFTLGNLGFATLYQGTYQQAAMLFAESLALFWDVEGKEGMAYALEGLAGVAAAQGYGERAAQLWGAAAGIRDAIGAPLPLIDQASYARFVAMAHAQLDGIAWNTAWQYGQSLSLEYVVAYALHVGDTALEH